MAQRVRQAWLEVLMAGAALLAGCSGMNRDSAYFPTGLTSATSNAPPGESTGIFSFSNSDPHAYRIEVRPVEDTNPVRTQQILVATVYDENGQARRGRRVEWMLEGVGHIIDVDEGAGFGTHGQKVNNQYAVTYTDYTEHRLSRNNGNPNDDLVIQPGQTWCVISSALEGDSYLTVYSPDIANWDYHKVYVTKHWVDADWVFPKAAINRAGTQHTFTTNVLRHSDHQPLANYRVRYRILEGPPAVLLPGQAQEAVAVSDLNGNASVTLTQVKPVMGVNRIGIEVIRAPDPCATSGSGIVIARGETTHEWQAPQISLSNVGPPTAAISQEVPYTFTVTNTGRVESRSLTVIDRVPTGMTFVSGSEPKPRQEGPDLIWDMPALPPGQSRTVQAIFRAAQPGKATNVAKVITEEGLQDEKGITTEIVTPGLKVTESGPDTGTVGVPYTCQIRIENDGTGPATNVVLQDKFDTGLEHESKANPVELRLGTLAPGQSRTVTLALTPRQTGKLANHVTATADGNLSASAEHTLLAGQAQLTIKQSGPAARYVGKVVEWTLEVANPGEVALNNVTVRDQLPPEVAFESATDNGQASTSNQVVWNLGALPPHEKKALKVTGKCLKLTPQAVNLAVASADPGIQVEERAALEVRGLPAFRLEVYDLDDPVEVGGKTTYKIEVTSQGSLPGNNVQVTGFVPKQMKVLRVDPPPQKKPEVRSDGVTEVNFDTMASLPPQQRLTYTIEVQAVESGDVRFKAELHSATLSKPVIKEESTNIYAPASETLPTPAVVPPPTTGAPATPPAAPSSPMGGALPREPVPVNPPSPGSGSPAPGESTPPAPPPTSTTPMPSPGDPPPPVPPMAAPLPPSPGGPGNPPPPSDEAPTAPAPPPPSVPVPPMPSSPPAPVAPVAPPPPPSGPGLGG